MQVVDNLLVIHNLDESTSQLYDLKLEDWFLPLLGESYRMEYGPANKNKYISEMLQKEEDAISNNLPQARDSISASPLATSQEMPAAKEGAESTRPETTLIDTSTSLASS